MERGKGQGAGRKNAVQAEEKVETLGDTLEKVEAKILEDTHGEKLKEVKLEMLETQWPMCKAEAQVDPLANKLKKVDAQTSLKPLVKVKAEAVVVKNEEALANKLSYTIT